VQVQTIVTTIIKYIIKKIYEQFREISVDQELPCGYSKWGMQGNRFKKNSIWGIPLKFVFLIRKLQKLQ